MKRVLTGTGLAVLLAAAMPAAAAPTGPLPASAVPQTVEIPAGPFISGSDAAEREAAYRLDRAAYGRDITRREKRYENERRRETHVTGAFAITRTPITNDQYAVFVRETGWPAPGVAEAVWKGYRLGHSYAETRRFAWNNGKPPEGRGDDPVVLVSHADAENYASWLSRRTGERWRLPTESEWEKAARGTDGRRFPWGNAFDPLLLDSADAGPDDTMPVGMFPKGASPFGVLDAAGEVFEWTATLDDHGRFIVKGGAWDERGCGACRPAARHSRPALLKNIVLGFRLVREEK